MTDPNRFLIAPVSGPAQMKTFITLPRRLYAGLPGWVSPLDMQQRDVFSPKYNPFFLHGRAQYFLAWQGERPVGRISAQVDELQLARGGQKTGYFGALDAAEPEIVAALLDAAEQWLRDQGMERMLGPCALNTNGEYGLMTEGQMVPPMLAMPWHPVWLAGAVEAAGFRQAMDLLSYIMETGPDAEAAHRLPRGLTPGEGRLGDLSVRQLNRKNIEEDGEILRRLYNESWENTWGFVPITKEEIRGLIRDIRPFLRDELLVLVEKAGVPVAIALVLPNLFDVAGDLGGAPSPAGWLKLGWRLLRHKFTSARVILLGVSREVTGTALGAMLPALMISELMKRGRTLPYRRIELGWVLETNTPMRGLIERIVPEPSKRHRVYEKMLTGGN
ncbi:hypothetical protein LOC54_01685 [Acetobacter sp. AN02]|uniref:GNAT family N-acetyltransferase n=1 Tax=Acetobacter sp. AN02 TaxID=2894186 RepID=UPI0024341AC3|nr:hypothetical protein [Acetobacter sp. AN02]MDG6093834.1 hypothetical protein [Acetobacter sp. AN02]